MCEHVRRFLPSLLIFWVGASLTGGTKALAAPLARTASLDWQRGSGAGGCVDGPGLARVVEARLGRPVFVGASGAEAIVSGVVERRPSLAGAPLSFAVHLGIADRSGNPLGVRDLLLDGADCSTLTEAIALVLAVTLDPDQPLALEAPVLPPPPPPPPPPLPQGDASLALAAGTGTGALPGPFVDLLSRLHIAKVGWPAFAISLGVDLPRSQSSTGGATASFSRFALALAWVPFHRARGNTGLRGLLGLEASAIAFAGHGFDQSAGGYRLVAAATAGLDLRYALGRRVFLFTALDATLAMRRERFFFIEADGSTRRNVFSTNPVTAHVVAGGGLGF